MKLLISICRDLFIALLAFAFMLSWGCISTSQLKKQEPEPTDSAVGDSKSAEGSGESNHIPNPEFWYLQEAPSTYYPVGLPSDYDATAGNSEWFPMKNGTFLIPLAGANGHSHTELLAEATKEQTEGELLHAKSRKAAEAALVLGNPVNWIVAGCMTGA